MEWVSVVKYFLHGIAFSVISTVLVLVWTFILVILVLLGTK